MDGILVIDKQEGCTSRDIVNIISKKFKTKKVGHTGTLDPLATGVLVICINKATKLVEILTSDDKEYIAEITLGIKTDTLDITGTILEEREAIYSKDEILVALNKIKGTYNQEVPIYSAVKIKGKKLYEYARENKEITLPKREVIIKDIELIDEIRYEKDKTIFKIKCLVSKGTYIRALANDIASTLNTIGVMFTLKRTKQGIFNLEEAISIENIENDNYQLIPIEKVVSYPTHDVDMELYNKIKNGQLLDNIYNNDIIIFTYKGDIIALYHLYEKDIKKLKPWKMF